MVNTSNSSAANSEHAAYIEQPASVQQVEENGPLTGFFVAGIVINIAMVSAYFIWAYRQWSKTNKRDK